MDLRSLAAFVEVVRRGGFSRAGAALHLTQPTISKAVRSLEDELGQALLVREGRRVRVTDAGRVAFDRAQAILAALHALEDEVAEVGAVRRGHLRLGIPPMVGGAFFPPVLADFRAAYPGVTLELREVGARRIEALVLEGEVEAGATVLPTDPDAFETLPLMGDVLRAVVHPRSALARRRQIALRDLERVPFVLYREDFALHAHILEACRREGFSPKVASESSQWDFMAAMVAADVGVALLPLTICRRLAPIAEVKVLPLVEPELRWDLALVWKKGRQLPPAGRAFVEVVRRHAKGGARPA
ncbi:MAG TPA: LysR family transcriptional regulator [Anaeromyxobacter sp.]|nr:LysR family transcriptional regulator [Anaeromyxobacter sp.]